MKKRVEITCDWDLLVLMCRAGAIVSNPLFPQFSIHPGLESESLERKFRAASWLKRENPKRTGVFVGTSFFGEMAPRSVTHDE